MGQCTAVTEHIYYIVNRTNLSPCTSQHYMLFLGIMVRQLTFIMLLVLVVSPLAAYSDPPQGDKEGATKQSV
jgi:hypothetical protein